MLRARRRDSPLRKRPADFARHTVLLTLGSALCALAVAVALFPLEAVLYTLVYVAFSSRITDAVFHGLTKRQAAIIISDRWEEIARELTAVHRIGITRIDGWGGYQGTGKTILYSIINRKNMSLLKRVVLDKDPSAFVAIMTAEDVTGVDVGNQPHW
ncbi:MAG: YitT family protein [Planctomycetes bacterium]|nr:YitT family protein [Planctomycetota bacterium]